MPDFAMCHDRECPSAESCQRSRLSGTRPDKNQEWWKTGHGGRCWTAPDCVFYLPTDKAKRAIEKRQAEERKKYVESHRAKGEKQK